METLGLLAGSWVLCGLLAFGVIRFRKPGATASFGWVVVQCIASGMLGAIALFAVLTNDDDLI
jgi:hypothetical protein